MAVKPPPHDGHADFTRVRVSLPAGYKPIADRNTSAQAKSGRRPQTIPNEFIYKPYP